MIWRMAWRNLWRHRSRTLIMGSAVAFSYALFLVSMGMGDDGHRQMLEQAAEMAGGDVLIHGEGYWDQRSSDRVLRRPGAVVAAAERDPAVAAALPRILVNGLVASPVGTRPVLLMGLDPDAEPALRDLSEDVSRGAWLDRTEAPDPLLLGATLVDKLELELGDRVVLTATDPDGEVVRALFHLTGVLETGMPGMDDQWAVTSLDAARAAVGMGGMLTQVGLVLTDGADPDSVASRLESTLGADTAGIEVLSWGEAVPEMVAFIEIDDAFLYIYIVVIFAVVAFAIANTFLMAVMERVRELGLLAALGLRGSGVARLLLAETTLLTVLALAAGFVVGYGGHLAIAHWGISIAAYGLEEMEISGVDLADMVMRSELNPVKWALATLGVGLVSVLSAVYPAWRAARLEPARAMRFYE